MALANRVSMSGVAEYHNLAIADNNFENDCIQMYQMSDTSNYQDLQTNRIQVYYKLAPTNQIELTDGPPKEVDQEEPQSIISHNYDDVVSQIEFTNGSPNEYEVARFISLQEEPRLRISHSYDDVVRSSPQEEPRPRIAKSYDDVVRSFFQEPRLKISHSYDDVVMSSPQEEAQSRISHSYDDVVRSSPQEEARARISHSYDDVRATEDETTGEEQRSHPRQFCDPGYCKFDKKVWFIIFFAMLLLVLSVLVVLFKSQLDDKIMMQGEFMLYFHVTVRDFL